MAFLRKLDLETWQGELLELGVDLVPTPACRFVKLEGAWQVEDLGGPHGTWVNGHRVGKQALREGDAIWLREVMFVFLLSQPLGNAQIERAIDEAPEDARRVKVWADWLLERGDALGEHLSGSGPRDAGPGVLEGLEGLVASGQLELAWHDGLIRAVKLRSVDDATWRPGDIIVRLLAVRVARWVRELTIDVSSWVIPSALRVQSELGALLRGLALGPELPALERLSFGYALNEELSRSPFLGRLEALVRSRFPRLQRLPLLQQVRTAWLEVEVPAGVKFYHPGPTPEALSLDSGMWVGAAVDGVVRAMAPGVARPGVLDCFVVRQEAPRWSLQPVERGVLLNGRPAFSTRLLPGDVITDPHGITYRFHVT
jgi:hypothetical protein